MAGEWKEAKEVRGGSQLHEKKTKEVEEEVEETGEEGRKRGHLVW